MGGDLHRAFAASYLGNHKYCFYKKKFRDLYSLCVYVGGGVACVYVFVPCTCLRPSEACIGC